MRMPIRRVIVGAIAGVGLAGLAALADSNQKHATTSVTTAQVDRKIKHYRHPMGLPDVSTSPKKDSTATTDRSRSRTERSSAPASNRSRPRGS